MEKEVTTDNCCMIRGSGNYCMIRVWGLGFRVRGLCKWVNNGDNMAHYGALGS